MSSNIPIPGQNGTVATNGTCDGTPRAKICVFCGSSAGASLAHMKMAQQLGRAMAENNIDLVYGGGTSGLMGEVAKTICSISGPESVHGIMPEAMVQHERDNNYQTVNHNDQVVPTESLYGRTTIVKDMHARKKLMAENVFSGGPGSGFIGLSGGYGTMEEVFEVITWNQLGIHTKGICLLNVEGYWNGILQWVNQASEQGFVQPGNENIVVFATDAHGAIQALRDYKVSESTFKLQWGKQ